MVIQPISLCRDVDSAKVSEQVDEKRLLPVRQSSSISQICECKDHWTWNASKRSHEVRLRGDIGETAYFHPNWSNSTAAVRGDKMLNGGIFYWEIKLSERVFGTSMMFGIGTAKTRLHADAFVNLLGEDENSMGLSHKGIAWYNGKGKQYTTPFRDNEPTTIGLLFDGVNGTLSYYKDGQDLGVAFTGINRIVDSIYPLVSSTSAKTEMTLTNQRRCYHSLQDRCRHALLQLLPSIDVIDTLPIPSSSKDFLRQENFIFSCKSRLYDQSSKDLTS